MEIKAGEVIFYHLQNTQRFDFGRKYRVRDVFLHPDFDFARTDEEEEEEEEDDDEEGNREPSLNDIALLKLSKTHFDLSWSSLRISIVDIFESRDLKRFHSIENRGPHIEYCRYFSEMVL